LSTKNALGERLIALLVASMKPDCANPHLGLGLFAVTCTGGDFLQGLGTVAPMLMLLLLCSLADD